MGKRWIYPIMLLMVLISACTPGTAGVDNSSKPLADTQTPAANQGGETAGKADLTIGLEADAATLLANTDVNYVTDVQIRNIYDPLIDRDKNGAFVPSLATEWKNIDALTWEFTLRDGVKFQNGEDFNADAVKFNIDYILDEKNKSAYLSRWKNIKEVKVIDPHKVQIITSEPFPTMLQRITDDLLIMAPKYVAQVGLDEAAKKPVGTGAYKVEQWNRDESLQLVANEAYWRGKPAISKLAFRYIPEFSARLSAFLSGEIQLMKNIPVDSVDAVKNNENAKIEMVASSRNNYIALNNFYKGPLQDKRVRQALNYAVNVDELLANVLNGNGTRMNGPLTKLNADYTETKGYPYDPEKAIALLKEAGYDPAKLELQLDTPNGRYPMDSHVAQAIASQLQKIGINVKVQVNEWGTHLTKIRQREMKDMFLLGWGPAFEAQATIENLFTKDAPYSGFYDPEVEKEIKTAIPVVDPTERKKQFAALQQKLVDEAAWIPLWQQADLYAVAKKLEFEPRPDEKMQAFEMKWSN